MQIGLVQLTTTADKMTNFRLAANSIRQAASQGAQLIVCPEATSQAFGQGRLDTQAEDLDGEFSQAMAALADELGVVIIAGMFRPADELNGKNRVYNTALITGGGHHIGYDKINTYDAFNYSESETVKPGEELIVFEHNGVNVGVAICFDIRFPALFQELARAGAELIVVPTSWADGEGKLEQWRTLTSARALDSTAFIAAAGQARPGGSAKAGQESGPTGLGHSTLVNPFGHRVVELGYEEETAVVEIDPALVKKARKTLPIL